MIRALLVWAGLFLAASSVAQIPAAPEPCSAPPEDCGGSHAFMANRQLYARFDRERSDEDIDEIMDEFDEEESDSFSDYSPDRFDRRQINRALAKLATGSFEEALDEIHHPSVDRISRRPAAQRTGRSRRPKRSAAVLDLRCSEISHPPHLRRAGALRVSQRARPARWEHKLPYSISGAKVRQRLSARRNKSPQHPV
jgi:hypothetical protein